MSKPIGSGKFARNIGFCFFIAAPTVLVLRQFNVEIPAIYILIGWLAAAGAILVLWGRNRIKTGDPDNKTIGMDTINMVVAILGVTFAIAALVAID